MTDLRHAFRTLTQSPGFTAVAVVILALGIAGNAVIFSLINGLFLKPLPFPHPEQLVDLDETAPQWNLTYTGINYDDFEAWREQNQTFAGMAHWRGGELSLAAGDRIERVPGQRVTRDLANVFGIRPVIGRMFTAEEELRGGPKVALIGHHIWQEWFGGDPTVVNQTVTIDDESYTIIGILPPTAVVPSRAAVWIPFDSKPRQYSGHAVGRLKPGVTIEQAAADLLRIHRARIPEAKENEITSPTVQPLVQRYLGGAGTIGFVLQSAVLVLLLIAGANIAGIMLARTITRTPELGLRVALGASRFQIVRQLMTESLLLASFGGAAGVLLGRWILDGIVPLFPDFPAWVDLAMDWRFAAFIGSAVVLCAAVAGLIPARHVLGRLDLRSVIGGGAAQTTTSATRVFSLRALVVGEVALAFLLLLVSGFLGRAFLRVQNVDPGIRPENVLTYGIVLPESRYRDDASRLAFFQQHLERLRALPDVESASASTVLPFSGNHIGNFFEPEGGLPGGPDAAAPVVLTRMSFPGYFDTMGIPLRFGRSFGEQDRSNVVIVNEALAQLFWPGENAVGKRMRGRGNPDAPWLEVVGVANDVRHYGLEGEIRPGIYVPFYAAPQFNVGIVVRAKGDPTVLGPTVRQLVREQDPTLPLAGIATMEQRIRDSLFLRRMYTTMTTTFAIVAATMAMAGLYGLIAYVVGQRTREFGIRLALGLQARNLLFLVLREGVRLAAVGIGLGLAAGILAGLALSALLMGVSAFDPAVLLGTTALLGAIVLAACLVPARRAARVNPVEALRAE